MDGYKASKQGKEWASSCACSGQSHSGGRPFSSTCICLAGFAMYCCCSEEDCSNVKAFFLHEMAWLLPPVSGGLVLLIVLSCSILCVVDSEILSIFAFLLLMLMLLPKELWWERRFRNWVQVLFLINQFISGFN